MVPVAPDHGLVAGASGPSQSAIDRAVHTLRRLAGWHIWPPRVDTIRELVPGDPAVLLPTKRLLEIESLSIDGAPRPVEDLVWDEDGVVYVPGLAPRRDGVPRVVEAVIRHGFDNPADIVGVALAIAGRSEQPQSSYAVGRISVGAPGTATPQSTEWRILDTYRLGPRP
ncbi:hypothetical protein F4V58_06595 [Corynebacterium phocae]|nr:hypothetical protein F4V58_06595 [Corynebacterium phocae]